MSNAYAPNGTALYLTLDEAGGWLDAPHHQAWSCARRQLERQVASGGAHWWHRSDIGLCAVFDHTTDALRCAWRLPQLASAQPSDHWRLSLDTVASVPSTQGAQVAHLHALAQLGADRLPLAGHRLRDALLDPMDAQVEDLGLCHLKDQMAPERAYRLHPPSRHPGRRARANDLPRLVLLAPQAAYDSPEHRAFGPLLVDRVSHQLGRSSHVRVVHPLSSRSLAARSQAPLVAQRWLGADYVLSGSYRVVGQQGAGTLQLHLSLQSARDQTPVWAHSFQAQVGDVLSSDSELVHAVSTGVHHAVLHAQLDWTRQQPLRALSDYALLLNGVGLMHRSAPDDFGVARQALLGLLERHPNMGQAHAWLAKWHVLRVTRALTQEPEHEAASADTHATAAMEANDAAGLARAMQGFVRLHLRRDLPGALADLQACTQEHPNEPLAWLFRGVAEAFADQGETAMRASQQALALSPLDPLLYYFESLAASSALVQGDAGQARTWCEQSLRRHVMHLSTHRAYITALWMQGERVLAQHAARQLLRLAPGYTVAQFVRTGSSAHTRLGRCVQAALTDAGIPVGH
jgi:adenylate cyclase